MAELKKLREKVQTITEAGSGKRNVNRVDIVESYEKLGLSHQEAVSAVGIETAAIDLTDAERRIIKTFKHAGFSEAEATLIALGRNHVATQRVAKLVEASGRR